MKRGGGKNRLALLLASALLAGCLCACGGTAAAEDFSLEFLSTGKSDCAILCMDGLVVVSDAADADDYSLITGRLDACGAKKIDYLVLSHYDKDHIGSAARLVRDFGVGTVLGPDYEDSSSEYAALETACADAGTPWLRLTADKTLETASGRILLDPPDTDYGDDNNNSLVMTVYYGNCRFLCLGDAKKARLQELLGRAEDSYTLVKLPHHGDSSAALTELIARTKPQYAVEMVSSAETVEQDLLDALAAAGTTLFCTRDGAVTARITAGELAVAQS